MDTGTLKPFILYTRPCSAMTSISSTFIWGSLPPDLLEAPNHVLIHQTINVLSMFTNEIFFASYLRIVLGEMETVDSLKMRMSLRLLIPSVNFHILHNRKELR